MVSYLIADIFSQMCAAVSRLIMSAGVKVSGIKVLKRGVRLIQKIKLPAITIETSIHTMTV